MPEEGPLAEPPDVAVEVAEDLGTSKTPSGFLRLNCRRIRRALPDGSFSEPFAYDIVERRCMDAVALLLHRRTPRGVEVLLRSQLRPPLSFRAEHDVPDGPAGSAVLWELPAGLIEPGERGFQGIAGRASAEALEETGYHLPPERFAPLGCATYPTAGLIAEKFHFVVAEVTEADVPTTPTGDGHVLEVGCALRWLTLERALDAVDRGVLQDVKSELALRRFAALREREA